jgi:hypothetical protein
MTTDLFTANVFSKLTHPRITFCTTVRLSAWETVQVPCADAEVRYRCACHCGKRTNRRGRIDTRARDACALKRFEFIRKLTLPQFARLPPPAHGQTMIVKNGASK